MVGHLPEALRIEEHGHAFSAGCLDSRPCDVIEGLASYLESTNKEVWLDSLSEPTATSLPIPKAPVPVEVVARANTEDAGPPIEAPAKKRQRCRTCGDLLGKDGHLRGQCPLRQQAVIEGQGGEDERAARARSKVQELGLAPPKILPKGQKRCPVCRLARSTADSEGEKHKVRNNVIIFCPFGDSQEKRDAFEEESKAKKKRRDARYNAKRDFK